MSVWHMTLWHVLIVALLAYPALIVGRCVAIILLRIVGVVLLCCLVVVAFCAVALGDKRGHDWG